MSDEQGKDDSTAINKKSSTKQQQEQQLTDTTDLPNEQPKNKIQYLQVKVKARTPAVAPTRKQPLQANNNFCVPRPLPWQKQTPSPILHRRQSIACDRPAAGGIGTEFHFPKHLGRALPAQLARLHSLRGNPTVKSNVYSFDDFDLKEIQDKPQDLSKLFEFKHQVIAMEEVTVPKEEMGQEEVVLSGDVLHGQDIVIISEHQIKEEIMLDCQRMLREDIEEQEPVAETIESEGIKLIEQMQAAHQLELDRLEQQCQQQQHLADMQSATTSTAPPVQQQQQQQPQQRCDAFVRPIPPRHDARLNANRGIPARRQSMCVSQNNHFDLSAFRHLSRPLPTNFDLYNSRLQQPQISAREAQEMVNRNNLILPRAFQPAPNRADFYEEMHYNREQHDASQEYAQDDVNIPQHEDNEYSPNMRQPYVDYQDNDYRDNNYPPSDCDDYENYESPPRHENARRRSRHDSYSRRSPSNSSSSKRRRSPRSSVTSRRRGPRTPTPSSHRSKSYHRSGRNSKRKLKSRSRSRERTRSSRSAKVRRVCKSPHVVTAPVVFKKEDICVWVYNQQITSGSITPIEEKVVILAINDALANVIVNDNTGFYDGFQMNVTFLKKNYLTFSLNNKKYVDALRKIVYKMPKLLNNCKLGMQQICGESFEFHAVECELPMSGSKIDFMEIIKILQKQNPENDFDYWGLYLQVDLKERVIMFWRVEIAVWNALKRDIFQFLSNTLRFSVKTVIPGADTKLGFKNLVDLTDEKFNTDGKYITDEEEDTSEEEWGSEEGDEGEEEEDEENVEVEDVPAKEKK